MRIQLLFILTFLLVCSLFSKIQAQSFQNPLINSDTTVYISVAKAGKLPEFPYGEKRFGFYVKKYMCPTYKANKLKGSVLFSFIIEKDGSITHSKVDEQFGVPTAVLQDIKCAIDCMPFWKPAISCVTCKVNDFSLLRYQYYGSIDQEKCIYFPSENLK